MVKKKKKVAEREEALFRFVIFFISGIVLYFWLHLNLILLIVNWILTLITGSRSKEIADFCEICNTQSYDYLQYISGLSNKRPFPFKELKKNITKFEK